MKHFFVVAFLFICLVFHSESNGQDCRIAYTTEQAWLSLVDALKSGNTEDVKSQCTVQGFASLISYISPNKEEEPFASVFRTWGQLWTNMKFSTELYRNGIAFCVARSETARLYFQFMWTQCGWKFHSWILTE